MKVGRILFIIGSIIFFGCVAYIVWDMSKQTVKPWGKAKKEKKEIF